MFNWLVNRVVTRVAPSIREAVREELDARDDSMRSEHRKLLREAEDTLDKLARRASREGMRKIREARVAVEDHDAPGSVAPAFEATNNGLTPPPGTPKDELRRRFAHMLRRPS